MILGIDIGGTHTDAVCLENNRILASAKVATSKILVDSIVGVIEALDFDHRDIQRIVLSTTLSTNAILVKDYAPAGMIIAAGPGIDPHEYFLSGDFHLVDGAIDHRGREYVPLDTAQVKEVSDTLVSRGIEGLGIVTKFSVRNSSQERTIHSIVSGNFRYITMGNRMGGVLNFPRRIHTTFFNTAVMPIQERFMNSVREALSELGCDAPVFFLKADGGTFSSSAADRLPVETILSGPSASMMGGVALSPNRQTTLVLDIGGTTTDIGFLVGGIPLLEPRGVSVGGLKTLVRGLNVTSVGAGGDSRVIFEDERLEVGPGRDGPPVAFGGKIPTPTDALSVLGRFDMGDRDASSGAIRELAEKAGKGVREFALQVVETLVSNIHDAAIGYIDSVNAKPVYTIEEMLNPQKIFPDQIMLIGGPAENLQPYMEKAFGLPCIVPGISGVANALGAALARTTAQITMLADTQMGRLLCPELDMEEKVNKGFSMADLKEFGFRTMEENSAYLGLSDDIEMDVLEEQSFNMVRGFSTTGRNMRLKIQTRPGIIPGWTLS